MPRQRAGLNRRAQELRVEVVAGRVVGGEEGDADRVQARLDEDPLGVGAGANGDAVHHLAVPVELVHLLAVDGDFELLAR